MLKQLLCFKIKNNKCILHLKAVFHSWNMCRTIEFSIKLSMELFWIPCAANPNLLRLAFTFCDEAICILTRVTGSPQLQSPATDWKTTSYTDTGFTEYSEYTQTQIFLWRNLTGCLNYRLIALKLRPSRSKMRKKIMRADLNFEAIDLKFLNVVNSFMAHNL